jgi:AbiTii
MASEIAGIMNAESGQPYQQITRVYWQVSPAAVRGVLDQIRTALAQLVGELRAHMSADEHLPSAEVADQAVNVVVTGKRSRVNDTAAQARGTGTTATAGPAGPPPSDESGFWTRSRKVGAFIVGLASLAASAVAVIEFL